MPAALCMLLAWSISRAGLCRIKSTRSLRAPSEGMPAAGCSSINHCAEFQLLGIEAALAWASAAPTAAFNAASGCEYWICPAVACILELVKSCLEHYLLGSCIVASPRFCGACCTVSPHDCSCRASQGTADSSSHICCADLLACACVQLLGPAWLLIKLRSPVAASAT